ncbi:hypothetical protein B0A48_04158 [Cryoendolithus antarcticus]|uniref:F-box domain-containing protein n=1 Tax=Cryoendolithus antarcticus TaxID=1507870 RepID=A0A1V8THJ5_9PEZI|nr:hypothetical protein B0A48_04158 [Cryoendolithus antarcticus]
MRLADSLDANYDVLKDLREALLQPLTEIVAFPGSTITSDIVMREFETAELVVEIFAHLDALELIAFKVTSLIFGNQPVRSSFPEAVPHENDEPEALAHGMLHEDLGLAAEICASSLVGYKIKLPDNRHIPGSAIRLQHHRRLLHQTEHLIDSIDSYVPEVERLLEVHRMLLQVPQSTEFKSPSPEEVDAVMRVFEVAELADGIFKHLGIMDLITFQRTSSRIRAVISGSDVAQRRMFLQPDVATETSPCWTSASNAACWLLQDMTYPPPVVVDDSMDDEPSPTQPEQQLSLAIKVRHENLHDPQMHVPPSLRALYICQPPVMTLHIRPQCDCHTKNHASRSHAPLGDTITSVKGITLGEILDVAHAHSVAHRLCPRASTDDHDSKGNVRVGFVLSAKLQLSASDPLVRLWKSRTDEQKRSKKVTAAKKALFGAYTRAKVSGMLEYPFARPAGRKMLTKGPAAKKTDSSKPIPTFAEWQDSHMKTIADAEGMQDQRKGRISLTRIRERDVGYV